MRNLSFKMNLLIINGPNLNLLGKRQPEVYGDLDFEPYLLKIQKKYPQHSVQYFQSNWEGAIIDCLQEAEKDFEGIILNAGAYTHTSIAIADAISSINIPVVEVHISNIFARESFRHQSFIAPYCKGSISGFGLLGYDLAINSFL